MATNDENNKPIEADEEEEKEMATITVHVKTPKDKKSISVGDKSSVKDFKAKISPEFNNTPVEQLCLIFSGKIMKDHETLETHNIKDGMTVHLVIRSGGTSGGSSNQASQGSQQQSTPQQPQGNP